MNSACESIVPKMHYAREIPACEIPASVNYACESILLKMHYDREIPACVFVFLLVKSLLVNSACESIVLQMHYACLLYTSPSPRDYAASRMPSSA